MNRSLSRSATCALALAPALALAACGDMTTGPNTLDGSAAQALGVFDIDGFDDPDLAREIAIDAVGFLDRIDDPGFAREIVREGRIDVPIADTLALRDDAQVLHVLLTFHGSEMALIEQALPRLRSTQARDFAFASHDEHAAALDDLRAQREEQRLALEPSELSLMMRRRALATTEALLKAEARGVDAMFIEQQLGAYTRALFIIDEYVAPAAQKRDVQQLVERTRDLVLKQQEIAQRLHLLAENGLLHDASAPM